MLEAYCATKGYITAGTGRWDEFRACKEIVRDFCDGVLLYVCPPDNHIDDTRWLQETEKTMLKSDRVAERLAAKLVKDVNPTGPFLCSKGPVQATMNRKQNSSSAMVSMMRQR